MFVCWNFCPYWADLPPYRNRSLADQSDYLQLYFVNSNIEILNTLQNSKSRNGANRNLFSMILKLENSRLEAILWSLRIELLSLTALTLTACGPSDGKEVKDVPVPVSR